MTIELSPERFDEGVGDFDTGHVLTDTEGTDFAIIKFTGYSEIDEETGEEHETINVHFSDGSQMAFEDLERSVYRERSLVPVSPDWFVDEVNSELDEADTQAAEKEKSTRDRERGKKQFREAVGNFTTRPVEYLSDTELFAKVSGAPLSIAEDMFLAYEGNLARMASSTPKQMQKITGIGKSRAEKIIAALELAKRLARFHATREKITSPADVADLMMSKLRYLQKEVVVVLALDTKGGITTTGKAGDIAGDLTWGKMLADSQVFEGTLNASVFHPREIFRFAIEESANSIVLVHNHPSGDPQPSQEDIRATKQLIEAGNQIGIKVLDHIIIGDGIFVSLKEEKLI